MSNTIVRTFELNSNIKLISLNNAFATYRGRRIKTAHYKTFQKAISTLIRLNHKAYIDFNGAYNPLEHEIHATLIKYTPDLFTAFKTISKRSGDIPNYEKCLTDCVLTSTIDDSQITYWQMRKVYREHYGFKLTLIIVTRS